ncbi:hypothetical protein ACFQ0X_00740 [Streptomyces rectiviolaceus]|uniref:hypothetical protein n=1 Tax=Streptomyces rectiviolaceus TaxID=332591 RepID=UPI00363E7D07
MYERVDACPHCRPDTVLGVLDWLWCFGQGRKVWRPPCGRFRLVWIRSRVDGGSMTIKKLVARATAVALLATGGLAVGTGAATAGGSHGAPGAGVAPMGDGSGSPGGGLAPMGPGGASGGGFAPADHEWGWRPLFRRVRRTCLRATSLRLWTTGASPGRQRTMALPVGASPRWARTTALLAEASQRRRTAAHPALVLRPR